MCSVIVFQPEGQTVSVFYPSHEVVDLLATGKSIVPTGVPFWIVDESAIPQDRTFRSAWELDKKELGIPSGQGE